MVNVCQFCYPGLSDRLRKSVGQAERIQAICESIDALGVVGAEAPIRPDNVEPRIDDGRSDTIQDGIRQGKGCQIVRVRNLDVNPPNKVSLSQLLASTKMMVSTKG